LFLFSFTICNSQNRAIDSLKKALLLHPKIDTVKTKILYNLGGAYYYRNLDTSFYYLNAGLELAHELQIPKLTGIGYTSLAGAYLLSNKDSMARSYYLKAIEVLEPIHYAKGLASSYGGISSILSKNGDYKQSIQYRFKQIKFAEESGSQGLIAGAYTDLANDYKNMQDFNKCLEYMLKAIAIKEKINDKISLCIGYINLGGAYHENAQFEKAIIYYDKALALQQLLKQENLLSNIYQGLCNANLELEKYTEALSYLKKNETLCKSKNDEVCLLNTYLSYSSLYERIGKNDMSEAFLLKAQALAKKLNYTYYDTFINESLYALYNKIGKHKEALQYYILFMKETTKQNDLKLKEQINDLEIKYQTAKKEEANKLLQETTANQKIKIEQGQYFTFAIIVFFALIILVLVLFIRQNKLKSQQKAMQLEQKLLRTQMNPHFIFNSLNSIHSVVLSGDSKTAAKYLASFSKMIRSILESSRFETISLEKELSLLSNYIELQVLRFENNIRYVIDISAEIDPSTIMLPPMLTQPFIENAIEHGLTNISDPLLTLSYSLKNDFLIVVISDNGLGFNKQKSESEHISMATTITKERLELLNKGKIKKTTFSISEASSNKTNKGVKISFEIPI
jgi:tetratricopeptide (TPR) repeat protein